MSASGQDAAITGHTLLAPSAPQRAIAFTLDGETDRATLVVTHAGRRAAPGLSVRTEPAADAVDIVPTRTGAVVFLSWSEAGRCRVRLGAAEASLEHALVQPHQPAAARTGVGRLPLLAVPLRVGARAPDLHTHYARSAARDDGPDWGLMGLAAPPAAIGEDEVSRLLRQDGLSDTAMADRATALLGALADADCAVPTDLQPLLMLMAKGKRRAPCPD